MFQTFSIDSLSFFEAVIQPAFADIVPTGFPFQGTLNEFTIMDNVVSKRPIIDIRRVQNILQRRDGSCDINYKKVVGATTRQIAVEEVYGATQFCRNEFYQGCLKDFRANDPLFGNKILPFFQGAVNVDIASNAYFGDVDRISPVNAQWSTNIFDGIFKWIKKYITGGVIPAGQTIAIADGTDYTTNATAAYNLLNSMYNKQPVLMDAFLDSQKAFYVSKDIASGYEDYLISTGTQAQGYTLLANGIKQLSFKGIPVLVENIWKPIIAEIKGSLGHAAILTLRGNFVFATDKNYGEGEDGKTALEVWYEKKEMQWYYRIFMKAGTQIGLPEFNVIALSSWS
ncbi:hypothetical protein [Chitinophaga tropicalis]|uniref:Phage capsid protein n=1 Tax=Chitinophaga tropicalis TaxID=2683588 RepID=A0A7K1UAH7_9BACT|nr:hypothetical protein [Chitinophaga tropicalis]MVT11381.1 hypothetical protein [Chitinophaga tropicalis]